MSKHHQSHRRRSYGRRQHELHERPVEARDLPRVDGEDAGRDEHGQSSARVDLDGVVNRMSFSVGD